MSEEEKQQRRMLESFGVVIPQAIKVETTGGGPIRQYILYHRKNGFIFAKLVGEPRSGCHDEWVMHRSYQSPYYKEVSIYHTKSFYSQIGRSELYDYITRKYDAFLEVISAG